MFAKPNSRRIHQGKENPSSQGEIHCPEGKASQPTQGFDRKLNERESASSDRSNLQRTIDQNKNADRQLKKDQEKLDQRLNALEKSKRPRADHKAIDALENSGHDADDAKSAMVEQIKTEARAWPQAQDIIDEAKERANAEAKKIVIQTIHRVATEHSVENSVSVFQIKNDDVKGRIIGREGRNIRALRPPPGEFIVDDTPEAII